MNDKIEAWIDRLDKYNICPYAAKSRRCIVEGNYNNLVETIQNWDDSFEVIIFVFKDDISVKLAEEYEVVTNKIDKNVLVLLDHYKVRGFIENNSTCNDSELIVFLLTLLLLLRIFLILSDEDILLSIFVCLFSR